MVGNSSTRIKSRRFSLLTAGYYSLFVLCMAYLAEFLLSFGYTEGFIGIVLTVESVATIATQILFGYLVDKYSNPKMLVIIVTALYTLMQTLLFFFSDSKAFILAFAVFGLGTMISLGGICDSWIIKAQSLDPDLNYSRIRSVGSITYGVVSLITGLLISRFSHKAAIFVAVTAFIFVILSSLRLENPEKSEDHNESVTIKEAASVLRHNRGFLLILLCCFVFSLSDLSFSNYYSVMINSLGGTPTHLGIGLFVMAASEFIAIFFLSSIAKKITMRRVLLIGIFGFFARSIIGSFAKTPVMLIIITSLQAVSFAFAIPACTIIISELIEFKYQATAIQLFQFAITAGAMIYNTPIGFLAEKVGIMTMIRISSLGALISGFIFLILSKRYIPSD